MSTSKDTTTTTSKQLNEEKLRAKLGWEPHEKQEEVIEKFNEEREVLLRAGRRFGKSYICSYLALREILHPNKVVWVVAPNYGLSEIIFNNVAEWISKVLTPNKSYTITKNPTPMINVQNGSTLEIKSAENPTSLLGRSTNLVILDEAARLPEYIWERYIYPTTHEKQGKIMYISTPAGKNWFYEKENELGDSAFHFTSLDNPHFNEEEWNKAKSKTSEVVFRQEYMAEYLSEANSVFGNVEKIVRENIESPPVDNGLYVMGVDIGRRQDASAIVIIERNTHKAVYVESFRGVDYAKQKDHIMGLAKRYNNAKIVIESTGTADAVFQDLQRSGALVEEFRTAGHNKAQLIEKLALFVDQEAILIPNQKELVQEMKDYEMTISDTGFNKYKGRGKKPDDLVIACALATWDLQTTQMLEEEQSRDISKRRRPKKILNEYE